MPYSNDIYRPDFQARIPDIEWMPEDEEQQPDFSPFAAALKRRFAQKPQTPSVDSRAPHLETEMTKPGHEAMAGGLGGGGGMKSL